MRYFLSFLFLAQALFTSKSQAYDVAQLKMDPQQILSIVLAKMNKTIDPSKPVFTLHVQSQTPLKEFQDAIETQWNFRPEVFTNAFAYKLNKIFLMDDDSYYKKNNRFLDDSLAHEIVHYVQVYYQNADLNDEMLEPEAIEIQTWFRETYLTKK